MILHLTCGLASSKALIGEVDDARYFEHPDRYNAEIPGFTNGFVEYVIPNFIPGFPPEDYTNINHNGA